MYAAVVGGSLGGSVQRRWHFRNRPESASGWCIDRNISTAISMVTRRLICYVRYGRRGKSGWLCQSRTFLTYHAENLRTGWFAYETLLTPATVSPSTFGLLHTVPLD